MAWPIWIIARDSEPVPRSSKSSRLLSSCMLFGCCRLNGGTSSWSEVLYAPEGPYV